MLKRFFRKMVFTASLIMILSVLGICQTPPPASKFEAYCQSGSTPLPPNGWTLDPSTGKYRAWVCVDINGNVTFPGAAGTTLFGGPFGLALPNPKLINLSGVFHASSSGTKNKIYTCPSGRRALILGIFIQNNTGGSASTFEGFLNISSTYYQLGVITSSIAANSNPSSALSTFNYIMEAGEFYAVENVSATTNFSTWGMVLEFDNTSPLRAVKNLSLATGDTTLYTVAAGKNGMLVGVSPNYSITVSGSIQYQNNSGATRTLKVYFIPSGGSDNANNLAGSASVANAGQFECAPFPAVLSTGSFININLDSGTGTQWAFVDIIEF